MENKEKNFVSAVIYVHNAENRISQFLNMIISVMEDNFEHSEIICVNDFSNDGSRQIIKETSSLAAATSITIIDMSYFHGLETAMNAGVDLAIGDFVFEFDNTAVDYDIDEIMKIYYRALQGYDIVSAAPDKSEKMSSRLFYKVFDQFTDHPYRMTTESFRILSRRVINRISSMNKAVLYRKAIYANCGLQTDTIKYMTVSPTTVVTDKRERRYRRGLAVDSLILFTELGYRFSVAMTVLMMIMSVFMTVYSLVTYLVMHPVEGWTTTVLFLSVAFFGLFGILTVIVKYLQLLVNLIFKRKNYSFAGVEKLTK